MENNKPTLITLSIEVDELFTLAASALMAAHAAEADTIESPERDKLIADSRKAAETVIAELYSYLNTNQDFVDMARALEFLKQNLTQTDKLGGSAFNKH